METQERLRRIDPARLTAFQAELLRKEYSVGTAENYLRAVRAFARWSGGAVERGLVLTWKAQLTAQYAPATVNAMLAGINRFFAFMGWPECKVKAPQLPRGGTGTGPGRIPHAGPHRQNAGEGAAGVGDGDYLRYGHPGGRSSVYHGGGPPPWKGGGGPEG